MTKCLVHIHILYQILIRVAFGSVSRAQSFLYNGYWFLTNKPRGFISWWLILEVLRSLVQYILRGKAMFMLYCIPYLKKNRLLKIHYRLKVCRVIILSSIQFADIAYLLISTHLTITRKSFYGARRVRPPPTPGSASEDSHALNGRIELMLLLFPLLISFPATSLC